MCSELSGSWCWFVTPTLFLRYQIKFHQFVTHLLTNAPTCLFCPFLDKSVLSQEPLWSSHAFLTLKQLYFSLVIEVSVVFLQMFKHLMLSSHKYFCDRICKNKSSSTLIISSNPLCLCFFLKASKLFPTLSPLFHGF